MKKITRKLVIRSETVRTIDNIDLKRARGGDDPANAAKTNGTESGINCPAQAAIPVPK